MQLQDSGIIDQSHTMYPSISAIVHEDTYMPPEHATTYCVIITGSVKRDDNFWLSGEYFCDTGSHAEYVVDGSAWFVSRIGFNGQEITGHYIEDVGRLTYIDNCSSTILVYPPRYGDPSLHLLAFPKNINQSYHTHPSIRMGLVLSGQGYACFSDTNELPLVAGKMFCLEEQEIHRFRTEDETMRVIAYHPDGNWGPTDEAHPMLNRTFLVK